ncbi:hypothetical protein MJK72_21100 [Klebsiella pneumoniae]|nr:hypothetical protein MJK72_21100 [Klebsiella pneumoniae]
MIGGDPHTFGRAGVRIAYFNPPAAPEINKECPSRPRWDYQHPCTKIGRSIKKFAIGIKTSYAHFLVIAVPVPALAPASPTIIGEIKEIV